MYLSKRDRNAISYAEFCWSISSSPEIFLLFYFNPYYLCIIKREKLCRFACTGCRASVGWSSVLFAVVLTTEPPQTELKTAISYGVIVHVCTVTPYYIQKHPKELIFDFVLLAYAGSKTCTSLFPHTLQSYQHRQTSPMDHALYGWHKALP